MIMSLSQPEIQYLMRKYEAEARDHEKKGEFEQAEKCREKVKVLEKQLKQREENQREKSQTWSKKAEVSYVSYAEREKAARQEVTEARQKVAEARQKATEEAAIEKAAIEKKLRER
jgi:hypothetical protein